jgi:hypothetical protein
MELGYCQACGHRNPPEDQKCKKCGITLINLDRSSNIVQGIRSGTIAGAIMGIVAAVVWAGIGFLFTGSLAAGVILFIFTPLTWIIQGFILGVIAGATSTLCYYRNVCSYGAIIGVIGSLLSGGSFWFGAVIGSAMGYLASYIERKYFRKMTWIE